MCLCVGVALNMDLVPLQSKIQSFAKYIIFFPPNFSFVFWKMEFWRDKMYSSKE
jgi:hypothetical protein